MIHEVGRFPLQIIYERLCDNEFPCLSWYTCQIREFPTNESGFPKPSCILPPPEEGMATKIKHGDIYFSLRRLMLWRSCSLPFVLLKGMCYQRIKHVYVAAGCTTTASLYYVWWVVGISWLISRWNVYLVASPCLSQRPFLLDINSLKVGVQAYRKLEAMFPEVPPGKKHLQWFLWRSSRKSLLSKCCHHVIEKHTRSHCHGLRLYSRPFQPTKKKKKKKKRTISKWQPSNMLPLFSGATFHRK